MANRMTTEIKPTSVLVGSLEGYTIKAGERAVPITGIADRARWSLLRLQLGRKDADARIFEHREKHMNRPYVSKANEFRAMKAANREAVGEIIRETKFDRQIQFILRGGGVVAVASTEHLLVPPEEVLTLINRYKGDYLAAQNMVGVVSDLQQFPGLRLQHQIDPGDILTRRAISIGYAVRVIACFNPLSFLGMGFLDRFTRDSGFSKDLGGMSRVLRFRDKSEMEEKIQNALEGRAAGIQKLKTGVEAAQANEVDLDDAKAILAGFSVAYGAGEKTVKMVWSRYQREEGTLWGAAMATSWVAQHGDIARGRGNINIGLAVAGAACLFITKPGTVADKCRAWLKNVKGVDLEGWK